jgi:RteC protein
MRDQCEQLYEKLLVEIGFRNRNPQVDAKWIEDCFQISLKACNELEEMASRHLFADLKEEIWFFKVMKPQFAAQMEYFTLLYMAEVFAPDDDHQRIHYWNHELKRSKDFFSKHQSFYQYYKLGRTECDPAWFVRTSTYVDLAATIIAREKYLKYLQSKLDRSSN